MSDFLATMAASSRARVPDVRGLAAPTHTPLPFRRGAGLGVIAEVKRRAPSTGQLATAAVDIVAQAQAYVAGGASAISVLTEPSRFDGSLEDLAAVAAAVDAPVMRKDFLVDPAQVREASTYGASGVLLIIRMLDDARLAEMLGTAAELGLWTLLEAFDADDLARVPAGAELVGVNCRNLATLQVDPDRFESLVDAFPPGCTKVAESGLQNAADARRIKAYGYDAVLVGSALMRADDPQAMVEAMRCA